MKTQWQSVIDKIKGVNPMMASLLARAMVLEIDNSHVRIAFENPLWWEAVHDRTDILKTLHPVLWSVEKL